MASVIKEAVSDIIRNHMQDPRIDGLVSITEVELQPDLKNAEVYLSIMSDNEAKQKKTFIAIEHAAGHIQASLGSYVRSRVCPHLRFHEDKRLKKTMETMKIINEVAKELHEKDKAATEQ